MAISSRMPNLSVDVILSSDVGFSAGSAAAFRGTVLQVYVAKAWQV
jgi:hypothetical protein